MGVIGTECPKDTVEYKLEINHTFNFSPGRLTEKMKIDGQTSSDAWCLVTVKGTKLQAEDCIVDYNFKGYFIGDDGTRCDISGASTALISFSGECLKGKSDIANIYLEITETGDPATDAVGTLNCPGYNPFAFGGFYPPSYFIANFPVGSGAYSDSDPGPDLTGQFEYTKKYTLRDSLGPY
jgi:hypothetical protein